jgi:hypothetical protein
VREIQRADPRARRKALVVLASGALDGLAIILLLESYRPAVVDWISRDPEQMHARLRLMLAVLAAGLAVPVLAFAAYVWRLGGRVVRAERFPPPGPGGDERHGRPAGRVCAPPRPVRTAPGCDRGPGRVRLRRRLVAACVAAERARGLTSRRSARLEDGM